MRGAADYGRHFGSREFLRNNFNVTSIGGAIAVIDQIWINGKMTLPEVIRSRVIATVVDLAGAGDVTQFTPSSGANYTCVNENPPDDDASYVEASASGTKDLYTYSSVTGGGAIHGVQIFTEARATDAGSVSLKTLAKSNGVESDDAGQAVATMGYLTYRRIMETDPSGNPWTQTSLNAAQFGVGIG